MVKFCFSMTNFKRQFSIMQVLFTSNYRSASYTVKTLQMWALFSSCWQEDQTFSNLNGLTKQPANSINTEQNSVCTSVTFWRLRSLPTVTPSKHKPRTMASKSSVSTSLQRIPNTNYRLYDRTEKMALGNLPTTLKLELMKCSLCFVGF